MVVVDCFEFLSAIDWKLTNALIPLQMKMYTIFFRFVSHCSPTSSNVTHRWLFQNLTGYFTSNNDNESPFSLAAKCVRCRTKKKRSTCHRVVVDFYCYCYGEYWFETSYFLYATEPHVYFDCRRFILVQLCILVCQDPSPMYEQWNSCDQNSKCKQSSVFFISLLFIQINQNTSRKTDNRY